MSEETNDGTPQVLAQLTIVADAEVIKCLCKWQDIEPRHIVNEECPNHGTDKG